MKPKATLPSFLILMGSTLLPVTRASADTYYWDGNDGNDGFQNAAPGPGGTWSASTPSTATGGFTTDATGSTAISANPNVTTTVNDSVYIGTGGTDTIAYPPPLYPFTGTVTIDGTVDVGYLYQADSTPNFLAINTPTINFADEGTFESGNTATMALPAVAITGASTSLSWKVGFSDNLNIQSILSNGAAKNILTGPGRLVVNNTLNLGPVGTPFEFDGGVLRINSGILWTSFSDMNADHPLTFSVNKDVGIDRRTGNPFTVDNVLNIGTGGFIIEGTTTADVIMNLNYQYSGPTRLLGGIASVETSGNLGLPASDLIFDGGTLKIRGTTLTNFSTIGHTVVFVSGKNVGLNIDDAGHTFTVDQAMNLGTGTFTKTGPGTVNLDQTSNSYTGTTSVSAGALNVSNIPAAVSGLTSVTGTGVLNLSGDNSAATCAVTMNGAGAILNLASASALGTGTCTLQAGTLKNSVTTLITTHPVVFGGNFTFDGVNNLTFGSGPITIAASRTITLNGTGSSLAFGGVLTNTQAGNPTLTVNGTGNSLVIGGGYALSNTINSRVPVINGSGNVTINGAVTNGDFSAPACGLSYTGTGTLTLNGNNTHDGLTTINSATGKLTLAGDNSGAAGGVTLTNGTLNVNSATALGSGAATLTAGTIDNTSGSAKILTTNNPLTFNGNFIFGGSDDLTFGNGAITNGGNRTITLNGTGSTLAFGGVMTNTLASNQTTTVNGAGNTLSLGGYELSNSITTRLGTFNGTGNVTITGAVTNGAGGATACTLTYSGSGTLTLKGINTYDGNTTVSTGGTLALVGGSQASAITVAAGASLGFELNSATTSSSSVNLTNGIVTISNPGAVDNSSDYLLMTAASGFTFTDPLTQLGTVITDYELQLQNGNTELWLVYTGVSGTPYDTWADINAPSPQTSEDDFDGDGVKNAVEFVLGGDKDTNDLGKLPAVDEDGTNMTFTFVRDQTSVDASVSVEIEVGTGLDTWPASYTVGADTGSSDAGVTVTDNLNGTDTVTLSVTKAPDAKKFARLKVVVTPP